MAVESVTYINTLDPNLPAASDGLEAADDHIRNIKRAIKDTFPNITGPVTATSLGLNSPFPIGGVIIWSGASNAVPAGWALCNGQTVGRSDGAGTITTPNLVDRFVVGAGGGPTGGYADRATGGNVAVSVASTAAGAHSHGASSQGAGAHSHGGGTAGAALGIEHIPPHTHPTVVANAYAGGSGAGLATSNLRLDLNNATTGSTGGGAPHAHGIATDGNHAHAIDVAGAGDHQHVVTIPDVRPPYFSLAYILKF